MRKSQHRKRNAILMPAGSDSLHRQYLDGMADFDLHLMVYDDSFSEFCNDTDYVTCLSGYKMDMAYNYIESHPWFLDEYEYVFLVDDDIRMTASSVNRLFDVMKDYNLEIAQPALTLSYGTYYITMHDPTCMLRYTDFVEMMMPCFSRDALLKVLPTFKEKVRWQGIEFHWPVLIDTCHKDMAVIDDILAVHARSIRSNSPVYCKLMDKYMKENHLSMNENVYGCVPRSEDTLQHDGYVVRSSREVVEIRQKAKLMVLSYFADNRTVALRDVPYVGIALFIAAFITEKREYYSAAAWWFDKLLGHLSGGGYSLADSQTRLVDLFLSLLSSDGVVGRYAAGLPHLLSEISKTAERVRCPVGVASVSSYSADFFTGILNLGLAYNAALSPLGNL